MFLQVHLCFFMQDEAKSKRKTLVSPPLGHRAKTMDQPIDHKGFVYSRLAVDPDLSEIVDMFVEEMPGRVATLLDQLNAGDWEDLRRTAHQLKGAAGSYGFDLISPSAGKVEAAIRDQESEERIREVLEELVDLCKRARCGAPH
jgi:histidine phosphotransfer protein HptB